MTSPELSAEYVATGRCSDLCGGDHGLRVMDYPFHARGCPVEQELRPHWQAYMDLAIAEADANDALLYDALDRTHIDG